MKILKILKKIEEIEKIENIGNIVKIENIETLSKILKKLKISASLPMYVKIDANQNIWCLKWKVTFISKSVKHTLADFFEWILIPIDTIRSVSEE